MAYQVLTPELDPMFMQGHDQTQPGFPPPSPPIYTHVMNQFPPKYIGYLLKPTSLPDGQNSWEQATRQLMPESEAKLAEIVKKDPKENKPDEALKNKNLTGLKRQHIYGILDQHVASETAFNMTWKLASIKVAQERVTTSTDKAKKNKVVIKSIRIILKRVLLQAPPTTRHQSISFHSATRPTFMGLPYGHQGTPIQSPHTPLHANPIIHQDTGHHGMPSTGGLFGEQDHPALPHLPEQHLPEGMTMLDPEPETFNHHDHHDYDDVKHHKAHKKDEKKQKDKTNRPPEIYIPTIPKHERHYSKNSSRPTSWYESDGFSVLESPMTSVSGSPGLGGWHEPKYGTKHYKKYRSGRGETSRHERRVSLGVHSNDSFVVIPSTSRSNHKQKHSSNSLDMVVPDRSKHRQEPQLHDDRLTKAIDKLSLEIEKKIQDQRKKEHDEEVINRLDKIETILHSGSRESAPRERPLYDRTYSEMVPRERPIYDRSYNEIAPRERSYYDRSYNEIAPRERSYYDRSYNEIAPRERAPYDRSYSETYEVGYGSRRRNRPGTYR